MNNAYNFSAVAGRTRPNTATSAALPNTTLRQLTLFVEATLAPNIPAPGPMATAGTPICPDTSLPWSDDYALGGWSARMFLHQLLTTSRWDWKPSDTESALSAATPIRLRLNADSGTLSSVNWASIHKTPRERSVRSASMVVGLIRRALARGRSFRLLLVTELDTIPVIVIFTTPITGSEFFTLRSENPLPDFLRDGLKDFLLRHAPRCLETASSPKSRRSSSKKSGS